MLTDLGRLFFMIRFPGINFKEGKIMTHILTMTETNSCMYLKINKKAKHGICAWHMTSFFGHKPLNIYKNEYKIY